MKKIINKKPYVGNLNDLVKHGGESIQDYWFILFQGVAYSICYAKNGGLHRTEALAKVALKKHIESQFTNGAYWHRDTKNTFFIDGAWNKNTPGANIRRADFKQMAIEMTEWLLEQKIFEIKQLLK
jgi:hypothetical protein